MFVGGDRKSVTFGIGMYEIISNIFTKYNFDWSLQTYFHIVYGFLRHLKYEISEMLLIFCYFKHMFSSSHEVGRIEHRASKTTDFFYTFFLYFYT